MKNIGTRIVCLFSNPSNDVKKAKPQLVVLRKRLQEIDVMTNELEAIVELFKLISPLQDKGGFQKTIEALKNKNFGQLDSIIESFDTLQKHINNAGREQYGINRTVPGEMVSNNNVYLGGVYGLNTHPVSFWINHPEDGIKTQARSFVQSHTSGMLEEISCIMNW